MPEAQSLSGPLDLVQKGEQRRSAVAGAGLLFLVVVSPWLYGAAPDSFRYAVVAAEFGLVGLALTGSSRMACAPLVPLAAALAIAVLQQMLGVGASMARWGESVLGLLAGLAVFAFWANVGDRPRFFRLLASALLTVAVAQSLFGIVQWSIDPSAIYGVGHATLSRPFGSYVNHNHFAGLVEMAVPLGVGWAVGRIRAGRGSSGSVVFLGVASLLVLALLASESRGGYVALSSAVVFAALVVVRLKHSLAGWWVVVVALGFVAVGLTLVPAARSRVAATLGDPLGVSATYRLDVARAGLQMVAARPILGWGLGNFEDDFSAFKRGHGHVRTTHAENDLLEWLVETGILGGGLLAGVVVWWLRRFWQRITQARDPEDRYLTIGAGAAVAALAAHSLVDFNLRIPANALVFASLAGTASAQPSKPMSVGGRHWARPLGYFLLACGVAAAWRAVGAVSLRAAIEEQSPARRLEQLEGTLRWHPYLAEGFRARGELWSVVADRSQTMRKLRLAKARADLDRAVRLRPAWSYAIASRAWLGWMEGSNHTATSDFAAATAADPTNWKIGSARAQFLLATVGPEAAVAELLRLESADPAWDRADAIAGRWGLEALSRSR